MLRRLTAIVVAATLASVAPAVRAGEPEMRAVELTSGAAPMRLVRDAREPVVWFASKAQGAIGRVTLSDDETELLALGGGAKPVALAQAANGRLYAVDAAADVIHEYDPATRAHVRHAVPSSLGLLELSAIVADPAGPLWFTGYAGIYGRFDPATGQAAVWDAPGDRGLAAIARAPDGGLWIASYPGAWIARIDPGTARLEQHPLPGGYEGPKALSVDAAGRVWVSAHRSGALLRFDPAGRAWTPHRLPGDEPKPHGVLATAAGIFVTDVGRDALLRFDEGTQGFVPVAEMTADGQARDIVQGPDAIWIAEAGADQILAIMPPGRPRGGETPDSLAASRP